MGKGMMQGVEAKTVRKVSVVMPVYNEEIFLLEILAKVQEAPLPEGIEKEIVIVDDCSTDGTKAILEALEMENVRVFCHEKNRGKGAALRTAYIECRGDVIIVQDADLEYSPQEYPKLLQPIIDGHADVVYGSRFLGGDVHRVVYFWHSAGNKVLTLFSNMFSDLNLTDMETCYKVFRRSVIEKITLEEDRFGIEPEFTAKVAELVTREGLAVYEVGIAYYGRTYEEGKKIGIRDGFRAAWCIWKYNTAVSAKIIKYGVHGGLVALFQILVMWLLVSVGDGTVFADNVANLVSIECALLLAFFLHSFLTWHVVYRSLSQLLQQLLRFHIVTGFSIVIRLALFAGLSVAGIHYMLNTLFGIGVAVLFNYYYYDTFVFSDEPLLEPILRKFRLKKIMAVIKAETDCHLLDVGCGFKYSLLKCAEPFIRRGVGVDFKVEEVNTEILSTHRIVLLDQLDFPDREFTIVTMLAVLEHLAHPVQICREISRVLRPGGKLLLTVPSRRAKPVLEFLAYKVGVVSEAEIRDHKKYYNKADLMELFAQIEDLEIISHSTFQLGMNNYCVVQKKDLPQTTPERSAVLQ